MPNDFIIRAALSRDYEGTCGLFDGLDELHRGRLPWLFRAPSTQPRSPEYFGGLLAADDSSVFVAEAETIIGVAIVLIRSAPDLAVFIPQRWAVIDGIVVSPAWRRRGVGTQLARTAEEWATACAVRWVELGVYDFNADARAFYEALGYLPVMTRLRKALPDLP